MAFAEVDEKLLVQAYQAGDERAFDTIVRTQYNALYAHAMRRLNDHESAEDAVQDTLLRAYRALGNLDGDLALRAWLHRILTNVCHDEGNRRRRQQGLVEKVSALPEETVGDPAEEAVLYDTVRVMAQALDSLPESYREALVLRYVDGLSFREVAEVSGITEENARARVHRGRAMLHKLLTRVAVLLAFIIPGLRRTQEVTPSQAPEHVVATGASDHAVALATQLTSHAMQAAPTMSRLAELGSSFPGGKSALAAAAITAVAAVSVSVPVAVHQVQDANRPRRPAAVAAAPGPTTTAASATSGERSPGAGGAPEASDTTTTTATPSTLTTLPPSQLYPFQATGENELVPTSPAKRATGSTTTTTSPATSTTVPPSGSVVEGRLSGDALSVDGQAPQWDVSGPISLTVGKKTYTGTINGRVYVYADDTAESDELQVRIEDSLLTLRFRGRVVETSVTDAAVTHRIDGNYVFVGSSSFGLPERGAVTVVFTRATAAGAASHLDLALRGQSS